MPDDAGNLAPVAFLYTNRCDKVAQAVSMAKAMQTNAWTSFDPVTGKNVRYDVDFIALHGQSRAAKKRLVAVVRGECGCAT